GSLAQCDLIHLTLTEAALRAQRAGLARALVMERTAQKTASRLNWLLQRRLETITPAIHETAAVGKFSAACSRDTASSVAGVSGRAPGRLQLHAPLRVAQAMARAARRDHLRHDRLDPQARPRQVVVCQARRRRLDHAAREPDHHRKDWTRKFEQQSS